MALRWKLLSAVYWTIIDQNAKQKDQPVNGKYIHYRLR